jgi:hypothetical protein
MKITKDMIGKRIIYEAYPSGGLYDAVVLNVSPTEKLIQFSFEHNGGGRSWYKSNNIEEHKLLEIIPKAREKSTVRRKAARTTKACCN